MNEAYTYELMPSAIRDLNGIMEYISVQLCAKESAINLLDEIEASIQNACIFPLAAPLLKDGPLLQKGYRKLIVKNYLVLYIPDDGKRILNVMRILYFSKDYLREL